MKNNVKNTIVGVFLVLVQALAAAQISPEKAEALTRKSGTWAQLANLNQQVKAGMAQSPKFGQISRSDIERLELLVDDFFSDENLRKGFVKVLAQKLNEAQSKASLRWYDSPTGKLITATEETASANGADWNTLLQEGNEALNSASEKRRSQLARLVELSHAAEGLASMQINVAAGILQGVSGADPNQSPQSLDAKLSALESQRPQMVAALRGVTLSVFARTYKSVSDKDLESYMKFLASKSGAAMSIAMIDALDSTLTNAFKSVGQRIPKPKPAI